MRAAPTRKAITMLLIQPASAPVIDPAVIPHLCQIRFFGEFLMNHGATENVAITLQASPPAAHAWTEIRQSLQALSRTHPELFNAAPPLHPSQLNNLIFWAHEQLSQVARPPRRC